MSYGTVQAEKMTTESGYSLGAGNSSSFKNRFINGAMVIDQRNNGASVTPTSSAYTVDRWQAVCSVASKFSIQQNAGSVYSAIRLCKLHRLYYNLCLHRYSK
jgi:hypothetical protein